MKLEQILITPDKARELLALNTSNRSVRESNVNFIAAQMLEGTFRENTGETIKINKNNVLIDGQHRLLAIIKANKTYELTVASELEEDVFKVIDTGKSRSTKDILQISNSGYDYFHLPSAVGHYLNIKNGTIASKKVYKKSADFVIEFARNNPDFAEVLKYTSKIIGRIKFYPKSFLAGMYFCLLEKGHPEEKIVEFFEAYSLGSNEESGSVINLLRDKLIRDSTNRTKIQTTQKYFLILSAWNKFITQRGMGQLPIPESQPTLI